MSDLDDYVLFASVVEHGGFAPAGRAMQVPKSKLSRRVARLEERLGVRLIERSTRRFRVTEVGQTLYEQCRVILLEVERARAVTAEALAEPQGQVRFSCPHGLIEPLSPSLAEFLKRHPKVALQIVATDRGVDLIRERIDVALRVRASVESDASLTMRTLTRSRRILVAGPEFARNVGPHIDALEGLPTLSSTDLAGPVTWNLVGPDDATYDLRHEPRVRCEEFGALRAAAAAGLGVALLPDHVCWPDLDEGRLVRLFPGWHAQEGIVHLVFTTRRGLPPAVRAFIDHLAATFRSGLLAFGDRKQADEVARKASELTP
ncbi:LysR substrate-binding domain-containing protein [Sphingomonas ginsenosidimutans]|uniref:LysR substrate-binding domain-containing protein n=1 Tax=Sphingomonas ginsenosidimutans TaxID=862134 RepID=UPI0015967AE1|nr:LysR substrate-binding domain-containing protein [Sphingomonas ginsenosidimutans]